MHHSVSAVKEDYRKQLRHLFFTAPTAQKVWKFFAGFAGMRFGLNPHSIIRVWWNKVESQRLQQIYKVIPVLICWKLWKRRNNRRYGGDTSINIMIHNIQTNIHYLIRTLYPRTKISNIVWDEVIKDLAEFKPKLYHLVVTWKPPPVGHQKCNADGTSRGNPGPSTFSFCIRDNRWDLCMLKLGF